METRIANLILIMYGGVFMNDYEKYSKEEDLMAQWYFETKKCSIFMFIFYSIFLYFIFSEPYPLKIIHYSSIFISLIVIVIIKFRQIKFRNSIYNLINIIEIFDSSNLFISTPTDSYSIVSITPIDNENIDILLSKTKEYKEVLFFAMYYQMQIHILVKLNEQTMEDILIYDDINKFFKDFEINEQ